LGCATCTFTHNRVPLSSLMQVYRPAGIGTICAALTLGRLLDRSYRREEARVGGDYRKRGEDFNIELARFRVAVPSFVYVLLCSRRERLVLTSTIGCL
jgi:hypothetical protein